VCFRLIGVWWSSGGGAQGGGWDDGLRRLPAITSSVGQEGRPRLYSSSIVLCNGAISASVQHHNFNEWGRGLEALEERRVVHRGTWGIGGRCRIYVLSVWWRSSNKIEGAGIYI